jgi:hypothetical protein
MLPDHPAYRIHDIAFATAIGTNDTGYWMIEQHLGSQIDDAIHSPLDPILSQSRVPFDHSVNPYRNLIAPATHRAMGSEAFG